MSWLAQHRGMLRYLRENVTVCTWGSHFCLGERDEQSIHFCVLLRVTTSTQMPRHMHRLSCQKQIMMSLGHCMAVLQ